MLENLGFKGLFLYQKRNIYELSLMMPSKDFDIFEEDMTQTIYENYLGILGVTEI